MGRRRLSRWWDKIEGLGSGRGLADINRTMPNGVCNNDDHVFILYVKKTYSFSCISHFEAWDHVFVIIHLVFLIAHLGCLMNHPVYRISQLKNLVFFLIYLVFFLINTYSEERISIIYQHKKQYFCTWHCASYSPVSYKVRCVQAGVPFFRLYFHSSAFLDRPPEVELTYKMTISYTPLHPTFVAEASGVDFDNIPPEIVEEIKEGLAKVCDRSSAIYQNHWQSDPN